MGKGLDKFLSMMRLNDDDYNEFDEYDDEFDEFDDFEEEPEVIVRKKSKEKKRNQSRERKKTGQSAAIANKTAVEPPYPLQKAAKALVLPEGTIKLSP